VRERGWDGATGCAQGRARGQVQRQTGLTSERLGRVQGGPWRLDEVEVRRSNAVQCRWRDRGYVLIDRRAGYCTGTDETRGSSGRFRVRSQWCWVIMGEIRAVSAGATAQESLDSSCFRTEDARRSTLSCHLANSLAGKGSRRGLGCA